MRSSYACVPADGSSVSVRPPGSCQAGGVTTTRRSTSGRAAISSSLWRYAATTRIFETIRTFMCHPEAAAEEPVLTLSSAKGKESRTRGDPTRRWDPSQAQDDIRDLGRAEDLLVDAYSLLGHLVQGEPARALEAAPRKLVTAGLTLEQLGQGLTDRFGVIWIDEQARVAGDFRQRRDV